MTVIVTDRPSTADALPSSDELVTRAADLVPLLRSNAETTEKQRRVVEENIDAIKAADLYKISVPSRLGGLQTDVTTSLRVSVELARGDGSTAWATTLMNVCAWMTGLFPDRAQQEVWGEDPTARVCGVIAPTATSRKVEGGLVVYRPVGFRLRLPALAVGRPGDPDRERVR